MAIAHVFEDLLTIEKMIAEISIYCQPPPLKTKHASFF